MRRGGAGSRPVPRLSITIVAPYSAGGWPRARLDVRGTGRLSDRADRPSQPPAKEPIIDKVNGLPGPLAGLRVIDFGQYIAGPLTAVLLADQGADVIHVDPPGGPRRAGVADAFFNRGKRRAILDLKQPGELAAARRLAASADVVIENFRPGVLARLGLDLDAIGGPARRSSRARCPASAPMTRAPPCAATKASSRPRRRTAGRGRRGAAGLGLGAASVLGTAARLELRRLPGGHQHRDGTDRAAADRARPAGRGAAVRRDVHPHRAQRCLRGQERGPPAPADPRARRGRVPLPGRPVRAVRHVEPQAPVLVRPGGGLLGRFDAELLDLAGNARPEVNERLHARLRAEFLTRTAAQWEELGNAAGAAIGFIRTQAEWIGTEQARRSRAVTRVTDPEFGAIWCAGVPVLLSEFPTRARVRAGRPARTPPRFSPSWGGPSRRAARQAPPRPHPSPGWPSR